MKETEERKKKELNIFKKNGEEEEKEELSAISNKTVNKREKKNVFGIAVFCCMRSFSGYIRHNRQYNHTNCYIANQERKHIHFH